MKIINFINLYLFIQIFHSCFDSVFTLSCLVIRPGKGLMSEKCSQHAVGCRIRIEGNTIQWYDYSKLYDRNQLVCVHQNEYNLKEIKKSGCIKKKSGSVRCWCYGQSNCNNPDVSTMLYQGFIQLDEYEFEKVIEKVDTNDQPDYENLEEDNIDNYIQNKSDQYKKIKPFYTNTWSYQLKSKLNDPIHHHAHTVRGGKDAWQDPQTINNTEIVAVNPDKVVNTIKSGKHFNKNKHSKYVNVMENEKNKNKKLIHKGMRPISISNGEINELGELEIKKIETLYKGRGAKVSESKRPFIQNYLTTTLKPSDEKKNKEKHLLYLEKKIFLSPNPEVTEDEFSELINTNEPIKIPSEISFHGESNYPDIIESILDESYKKTKNTNDNFTSNLKINGISSKNISTFILVIFSILIYMFLNI
uniref:Activin types I and II receptor domain-containing protein n=2 Tax=Strongyloides stercoralis TaxID=6248 RepID=A0A0K0DXD3_STRER